MKSDNSNFSNRLKQLTPLQYDVTQNDGTEPPFDNQYWDNKKEGIYVDIVSGEPLFSSMEKYDSGTGWPSFFKPLEPENLIEREDRKLFRTRTEIRSRNGNSHLGHVFDDGPVPTGKRYCMNSAAMRFIAKEDLSKEGYEKYADRFSSKTVSSAGNRYETAYFAGGCFWCVEADFLKIKGVVDVESGYIGGDEKDPSYEQVSSGETGHAEAVKVTYNPHLISYDDLLKVFWLSIDPTVKNRQFCDVGKQYRSAIFFADGAQEAAIKRSVEWLKKEFPAVMPVTEISPAKQFYKAEGYHQRYAEKNPIRYKFYRFSCGRDRRLKELFSDKRERVLSPFVAVH